MAISYHIDKEQGVIFAKASGILTTQEMLDYKRRLLADPDYRPGLKELSDICEITALDVSTHDVGVMTLQDAMSADLLKHHVLAIVAQDDLAYGMARMYQSMAQKYIPQINIFRDMRSARAWLGLPEEE